MEKPYMVSETIKYSDGSEKVITYVENPDAQEIEAAVAEATAITSPEDVEETVDESDEDVEVSE